MIVDGILQIHKEINTRTGLRLISDGVDMVSENYPFVVFSLLIDDHWKPHQIRSKTFLSAGVLKVDYSHPVKTEVQYSYIDNGDAANFGRARDNVQALYNSFLRATTKEIAAKSKIGYTIISPITPGKEVLEKFRVRQFSFDVRYFYKEAVIFTDELGIIESVNTTRSLP